MKLVLDKNDFIVPKTYEIKDFDGFSPMGQ